MQHSNGEDYLLTGRLPLLPDSPFQRKRVCTFRFNGASLDAYEGEPIAVALWAIGQRLLSRSWKFHRPRGPFCFSGYCGHCVVEVNGVANVQACMEPVQPGLEVKTQGGFPSVEYDLLALLDFLSPWFPAGFQHHYFTRSFGLFTRWAILLRMLAGSARGAVYPLKEGEKLSRDPVSMRTEIAVVGGGLAGLAAALEAARYVDKILLIERQPLLVSCFSPEGQEEARNRFATLQEMIDKGHIELMTGTTAVGYYGEGLLGLVQRDRFIKLQAKQIIVATGAYEQPLLFENNDLPGIISMTAALKLVSVYRIAPCSRAVVTVQSEQGLGTALRLHQAGLPITAIVDLRSHSGRGREEHCLTHSGVEYLESYRLSKAIGRRELLGVLLEPQTQAKDRHRVDCDLLITEGEWRPANELAFHALYEGSPVLEAPNRFFTLPVNQETGQVCKNVYIAGAATGVSEARAVLLQGQLAGISAVLTLGKGGAPAQKQREQLTVLLQTGAK